MAVGPPKKQLRWGRVIGALIVLGGIAAGIIYFTVVFILTRIMGVIEGRLTRYRTAKI